MAETKNKSESAVMARYLTMNDVIGITGLSWVKARKLVDEAGAVVRVGRRVLILPDKLDEYLHMKAE
jgi:hypothetical protein